MGTSEVHWLDCAHQAIQGLEFEHPPAWWVVRNLSRGVCYYAFEPEVWDWERWLKPNGSNGAGDDLHHHTRAGERYGMLTELQLREWLRRYRSEGTLGVVDMERQRIVLCSCRNYYDYLTRKHQYHLRDERLRCRMAKRIA